MDKGKIVVPDPAEIEPEDIGPVMAQMAAIQLSLATRLVAASTRVDMMSALSEAGPTQPCVREGNGSSSA
jgi:hypothetical protein